MAKTFEDLSAAISKYTAQLDFERIQHAYLFAKELHKEQKRESGEPYIIHPLEVAYILASMRFDADTIVAALLHDVIEDTKCTYEEIQKEFGSDVAELVDGVTKLEKIQFIDKQEQQMENLRKMLIAMAKDIRVIIIKLADRLHNMRTMMNMPPEKRLAKSRETLEVYAPLAHRLGMSRVKLEMEDLSLKYLDSVAYYEIEKTVKQKLDEVGEYIDTIKDNLSEKIHALGIEHKIDGRVKHIYSIFRKMYTQDKTIEEIYDLFAVRILVETVNDCYAVLGMVHEAYRPIPGKFKDYIAMPKPNMYQSLHTTLIGPTGVPFEVQIRTYEMHNTAEYGIAAHWKYKQGVTNVKSSTDAKFAWVRQLLEIQRDADSEEDFMRTLKIDMFADEVFVFTPQGDVINLPTGSTAIDFAFAIHSAVGNKMTGAKANSKIVPLDYQLKTGDIVEILTSPTTHGPSRDWLSICKTSQAKTKINSWFKKERREENIAIGKEQIEKEAKKSGHPLSELMNPTYLGMCLKRYGIANEDDMYAAIGFGTITAAKIITRLESLNKDFAKEKENIEIPERADFPNKQKSDGISVKGIDNCLVRVSRCCTPLPGDKIIGFITRGRGVSVHRADCVNVAPDKLSDEERSRLVECTWDGNAQAKYLCDIQIHSTNRNGLLVDITQVLKDYKLNISGLTCRVVKDKIGIIYLTIEISGTEQLDALIKRFYTVPGVFEVVRSH